MNRPSSQLSYLPALHYSYSKSIPTNRCSRRCQGSFQKTDHCYHRWKAYSFEKQVDLKLFKPSYLNFCFFSSAQWAGTISLTSLLVKWDDIWQLPDPKSYQGFISLLYILHPPHPAFQIPGKSLLFFFSDWVHLIHGYLGDSISGVHSPTFRPWSLSWDSWSHQLDVHTC